MVRTDEGFRMVYCRIFILVHAVFMTADGTEKGTTW